MIRRSQPNGKDLLRMAFVEKTVLEDSGAGMSEATAGDFFALLKPRVMSLVVFTAFVGLVAAPVAVNPVIAVTASAMPEDRKKILAAGFDGMQTKPIHVTEFLGAIEDALMRGQRKT